MAKPRPASPARAASMVAFSASRLVWAAMARISSTTSPIFCAASLSCVTDACVALASSVALSATWAERATRWLISAIDADSSSVPAATV